MALCMAGHGCHRGIGSMSSVLQRCTVGDVPRFQIRTRFGQLHNRLKKAAPCPCIQPVRS